MMHTIRWGESAWGGGVCLGGSAWGCLPRGVSTWGVYTSPLWIEFLTHACENITFPQLRLRTVIKLFDVSRTQCITIYTVTIDSDVTRESPARI